MSQVCKLIDSYLHKLKFYSVGLGLQKLLLFFENITIFMSRKS